jgi:hypothetical protein
VSPRLIVQLMFQAASQVYYCLHTQACQVIPIAILVVFMTGQDIGLRLLFDYPLDGRYFLPFSVIFLHLQRLICFLILNSPEFLKLVVVRIFTRQLRGLAF